MRLHMLNFAEVKAALDRKAMLLGARLGDSKKKTAVFVEAEAKKNVEIGMGRGLGWPAWAPSTLERKRGAALQGLIDTRELYESIRGVVEGDHVKVYTDAPHAGFHEYGTRTVPMRPFMRPALYLNQKDIFMQYKTELKKAL